VLHEVDGYSMEEIAAMQRVSVAAAKSRVARGRERLRRHYERLGARVVPAAASRGTDAGGAKTGAASEDDAHEHAG
jgi:hypothetical protein